MGADEELWPEGAQAFPPLEEHERYGSAQSGSGAPRSWPEKQGGLTSGSALFDRVGALVIIFDRQGRILWYNRACAETTGLSFQEVWGRHIWEVLVLPEERDVIEDVVSSLRRDSSARAYESRLLTGEGQQRTIRWSTAALPDGDRPVEHIVGVGVDITDRQHAENDLRKREEHYRRLVESSPDAIFVHHRGKMVFANRAGAVLLGASDPGEIMGRSVLDRWWRHD
jgi:PAS domain S-box-containing protein